MRGALLGSLLTLAAVTAAMAKVPPIVLLVVLDGVRSDRLGCSGAPAHATPLIDRLCGSGTWFTRAYAQSSWGAASMASLLTSTLPSVHGVNAPQDALAADRPTLGSAFAAAGYLTRAFTTDAGDGSRGLLRGFTGVDTLPEDDIPGYRFEAAERSGLPMLGWLDDHRRDLAAKGALLLMHVAPARLGYLPPSDYLRRFMPLADVPRVTALEARAAAFELHFPPADAAMLGTASESGVALADGTLALVLDALRAPELAARLWIVLTSSYGEALGEHGLVGHGITLYDETIHVPLLVVPPAGQGHRGLCDAVVELADVLPTLLDVTGVPVPGGLRGRSLAPALAGHALSGREAVSELVAPTPIRIHTRAVIDPGLRKVLERQDRRGERYDLRKDPGERVNLAR